MGAMRQGVEVRCLLHVMISLRSGGVSLCARVGGKRERVGLNKQRHHHSCQDECPPALCSAAIRQTSDKMVGEHVSRQCTHTDSVMSSMRIALQCSQNVMWMHDPAWQCALFLQLQLPAALVGLVELLKLRAPVFFYRFSITHDMQLIQAKEAAVMH